MDRETEINSKFTNGKRTIMSDPLNNDSPPPLASDTSSSSGYNSPRTQRVCSDILLSGRSELVIEHEGEEYRLRRTSKGKLILTK